jgi:hypothetical protein
LACPQGMTGCPGDGGDLTCTNVAANDNACGACDVGCANGAHCVAGLCQ